MATYLDVLAKILLGERTSAPEINRLVSRRVPPIEGGRMLRNAADLMQYAPATTGMAEEGVKTALDEKGRTVTADMADKVVSDTPVEYVFQANPSCCSDCSRRDGMTVPAGTTLRSISHPNCCCAIVPRTEYKPFGAPTSGVDKSRGGAGKVGLGPTIAADRYQEFLKGLENS